MNETDFTKYYWPAACNLFGDLFNNESNPPFYLGKELDRALGLTVHADYNKRLRTEDPPMSDELKSLCLKLMGPHGKAILRAYQIQKG